MVTNTASKFVSNPDWISYGNVVLIESIAVAWWVGGTQKKEEVELVVRPIVLLRVAAAIREGSEVSSFGRWTPDAHLYHASALACFMRAPVRGTAYVGCYALALACFMRAPMRGTTYVRVNSAGLFARSVGCHP